MGLDMYLRAGKYASSYTEPELYGKIVDVLGAEELKSSDGGATVELTVGYWRKANAIHNWFMELTDEDNCQPVYVERERLVELLTVCKNVLEKKDKEVAQDLLPTTSGFFFGSTEYDEWYWFQVEQTITILENILAKTDDNWYFEYQASW
jgi:hypothetical protein